MYAVTAMIKIEIDGVFLYLGWDNFDLHRTVSHNVSILAALAFSIPCESIEHSVQIDVTTFGDALLCEPRLAEQSISESERDAPAEFDHTG